MGRKTRARHNAGLEKARKFNPADSPKMKQKLWPCGILYCDGVRTCDTCSTKWCFRHEIRKTGPTGEYPCHNCKNGVFNLVNRPVSERHEEGKLKQKQNFAEYREKKGRKIS